MWRDRHGNIMPPRAVDWLKFYHDVWIFWWTHNPENYEAAFVRDVDTSESEIRKKPFSEGEDVMVLASTGTRKYTNPRGCWIKYSAVQRRILISAHRECEWCGGSGIAPQTIKKIYKEHLCSCIKGNSHWVVVGNNLIKIRHKKPKKKLKKEKVRK